MAVTVIAKPNRSALLGSKITEEITEVLIQFDASISERYSRQKEITAHPVEDGADVTDHQRTRPTSIEIHGWVSDTPIIFLASLRAQPSVSGGDPRTRAADAWRELNRIMDAEQSVKVITELGEFDNMALSSIDVSRDKDTGRILDARISLTEIIVATTETVALPQPAPPAGSSASNRAPKINKGKQVAKPPANQSVLFSITKAIGG